MNNILHITKTWCVLFVSSSPGRSPGIDTETMLMNSVYRDRFPKVNIPAWHLVKNTSAFWKVWWNISDIYARGAKDPTGGVNVYNLLWSPCGLPIHHIRLECVVSCYWYKCSSYLWILHALWTSTKCALSVGHLLFLGSHFENIGFNRVCLCLCRLLLRWRSVYTSSVRATTVWRSWSWSLTERLGSSTARSWSWPGTVSNSRSRRSSPVATSMRCRRASRNYCATWVIADSGEGWSGFIGALQKYYY